MSMWKQSWFRLFFSSWVLLAIFSVRDYTQIVAGTCYFQTTWLFCRPTLPVWFEIGLTALIAIVSVIWMVVGRKLWQLFDRVHPVGPRALVGVALVGGLAMLVVPFGSSDTSYYFHAGRAVSAGLNPYVQSWPMDKEFLFPVPHDMITSFSYGPIMLSYFHFLSRLSGDQIAWFLIWWRATLIIFFALAGYLTYRIIRMFHGTIAPSTFACFWFLQPLLLFEILTNGHFDIIWVCTVLGAIIASVKKQWWLTILLLTIGIWIKFIPLLFAPFFALWWWQEITREDWRKQCAQVVIGVLLSAAATVVSWGALWQGPAVFTSVVIQSKWAVLSWFAIIYYSLQPLAVAAFGQQAHWILTRFVHALLLGVLGVLLWPYIKKFFLVLAKKQTLAPIGYVQAMLVCLLAYLFIWQKSLWPWYSVWLIPIGMIVYATTRKDIVKRIVRTLCTIPLVFYSVWLANWYLFHADGGSQLWFYYFMVLSCTGYPLFLLWQWRKKNFVE